VKDEDEIVFED